MKFSGNSRLADIIHQNHLLLPVINRFGIRLGTGEKTVKQICSESNVNMDFFLEVINAYHDPEYFPQQKMISFPASMIVEYLKKTHRYYIDYLIPNIERLLRELIESCKHDCNNLRAIEKFYMGFKTELMNHIREEEEKVFPYIDRLESGDHDVEKFRNEYTIHSFEEEHSQVDEKLLDLKNIIIKFLPPSYDDNLCNEFLFLIFQFEKDLQDHARIEDKILIPLVKRIEHKPQ